MISFHLSFGKKIDKKVQGKWIPPKIVIIQWLERVVHAICRLLSLCLGITLFYIYLLSEKASGKEIVSLLTTIVCIH